MRNIKSAAEIQSCNCKWPLTNTRPHLLGVFEVCRPRPGPVPLTPRAGAHQPWNAGRPRLRLGSAVGHQGQVHGTCPGDPTVSRGQESHKVIGSGVRSGEGCDSAVCQVVKRRSGREEGGQCLMRTQRCPQSSGPRRGRSDGLHQGELGVGGRSVLFLQDPLGQRRWVCNCLLLSEKSTSYLCSSAFPELQEPELRYLKEP